jgi:transcriptional regulator with XRE-family HTH domain
MLTIDKTRLFGARKAAELSRDEVGVFLGKTSRTIEAYERGTAIPPGNVLVALAALYGVTVEDLCTDDPQPFGPEQRRRLAALLDLSGRAS